MDTSTRFSSGSSAPTTAILSIPYRPHTVGALLLGLLLLTMLTALILLVGLIGMTAITWGLGLLLVLVAALYLGCFLHPSSLQVTPSSVRIPTGLLFRSYRRIALREVRRLHTEGPDRDGEHFALEEEAVLDLPVGQVVLARSRCVSVQDYERLVATLTSAMATTPAAAGAQAEAQAFPADAAHQVIAYQPPAAKGGPAAQVSTITIAGDRFTFPTGNGQEPMLTIALSDLCFFGMSGPGLPGATSAAADRHQRVERVNFTVADRSYLLERRCCAHPQEFSAVVDFFLSY